MADLLHLHIEAQSEAVVHLRAVSQDGIEWYALPEEEKPLGQHKHLMTITKVKQAANDCSKVTGSQPKWPKYRRIKLIVTELLKELYFDAEGDLVVNGHYLEAIVEEFRHDRLPKQSEQQQQPINQNSTAENSDLKMILERLLGDKIEAKKDRELVKLKDLKNLFMISEYDGKANAQQWLTQFIKECERLEISEPMRSEALKMFISKNLNDWYLGNTIKLAQSDWKGWKQSFTDTYSKKGWSEIRDAYRYQYYHGSLVDYANCKERKLLEADREMPEKYRVIQIVVGLPASVRDEIDREKTTTFADLVAKLREQEDSAKNKKHRDRKRDDFRRPNHEKKSNEDKPDPNVVADLFKKKKPCGFCEMIGFKNNFHRVEDCKNKTKYAEAVKQTKTKSYNSNKQQNKEVNLNELVGSGSSGRRRSQSGDLSGESSDESFSSFASSASEQTDKKKKKN